MNELVSCLLLSSAAASRRAFLEASVAAYCAQTWPARELIMVCDGGAADRACIGDLAMQAGRDDIRCLLLPEKLSLGALRNASIAAARGRFLCQWDDDDIHHPRRIEAQVLPLVAGRRQASYLREHLYFLQDCRQLYVCSWAGHPLGGHSGTLTAVNRDLPAYPEDGPRSGRGEDSFVHQILRYRRTIAPVSGQPYLYTYRFHGANTWNREHHVRLAGRLALPREDVDAAWTALERELVRLPLGPAPIDVMGRDGLLRRWTPPAA